MPNRITQVQELFGGLKYNDPKVVVTNSGIDLIPFYGSFNFMFNFIPLIGAIYIIFKQNDHTVNLLVILAIFISLFNIYTFIISNNKIVIDGSKNILIIIPNILLKYFKKEKLIPLESVAEFLYSSDSIWIGDRRFKLKIKIKSSNKLLHAFSTSTEETAKHMVLCLSRIN